MLISSRPQSKFFQRQVCKYILSNMNAELKCWFHSCVNKDETWLKYQLGPYFQVHIYCMSDLPKRHLPPLSLPQQSVTLPELPTVVVFKDGGYLTYDGESFLFVFRTFVRFVIKKTLSAWQGGVCLLIFPLPSLPLAFFFFFLITVCMFSHRWRSASFIFLAALQLWRARPITNRPGRCPLLCAR